MPKRHYRRSGIIAEAALGETRLLHTGRGQLFLGGEAGFLVGWESRDSRVFYSRNRLDAIQIRYGADDNGNGELVRQYSLTYAADSTDHIFPNITADGGFRADAVRPYAVDDSDDARLGCMACVL